MIVLLLLVAACIPRVGDIFAPKTREVLATLRLESKTVIESAVSVKGYYEQVADTPIRVSPLLAMPGRPKQKKSGAEYTEFTRPVDDWLDRELIPNWSGTVAGKPFNVNALGLRDRKDVAIAKPADVCRIAVIGSSVVMGWGVADDEHFPRLLQERLQATRGESAERIEVLNFGTGNSDVIHRRVLLERKVLDFKPDAVFYIAHQNELLDPVRHLAKIIAHGYTLKYPCLQEVAHNAGVTRQMQQGLIEARLETYAPQIVRGIYADFVAECRSRGVLPVWVYVPIPGIVDVPEKSAEVFALAEAAGFVVIDLSKWDRGHAPADLKVDEHHANALGHRVIAERLEAALRARPEALPPCARPRP